MRKTISFWNMSHAWETLNESHSSLPMNISKCSLFITKKCTSLNKVYEKERVMLFMNCIRSPPSQCWKRIFFYVYLFMHLFILLPNTRINVKGRFHSLCLFVYPFINLSINSHVHPVTRRHVKSFFIPSVYLLIFSFIYSFTNSSICVFLLCSSVLKSLKRKNCFIPLSFTLG